MNNEAITLTENEMMTLDYARLDQIEPTLKKSRVYEEWIDDLSCDVKAKNILKELIDVTYKFGNKVYQIGKAVLEFLMKLKENYPRTFDLAVICAVLSLLVWCIPGIGPIIGPFVTPLVALAGALVGLAFDLGEEMLVKSKINEFFGNCGKFLNAKLQEKRA